MLDLMTIIYKAVTSNFRVNDRVQTVEQNVVNVQLHEHVHADVKTFYIGQRHEFCYSIQKE